MNTRFAFDINARDWSLLCRCSSEFVQPQTSEQEFLKERVETLFYFNGKNEGSQVEKEYATYLVSKYIETYADLICEDSYFYDSRYSVHTCLNHLRTFFQDNDRLPNLNEFYKVMEEK